MKQKFYLNKKFLSFIIGTSIIIVIFSGIFLFENTFYALKPLDNEESVPRAVIIDQLSSEIPNTTFENKSIQILEGDGYLVDYIKSENVTVDFYKELPGMNYELIVFRTHAIAKQNTDPVTLFTGESYSTERYITEQLLGYVKRAAPIGTIQYNASISNTEPVLEDDGSLSYTLPVQREAFAEKEYFAISPKLVHEIMVGKFPSSTIILGGCNTLSNPTMAEALVARGASTIVGWDDQVSSWENDKAILTLLEETVTKNQEMEDAIITYSNNKTKSGKLTPNLKVYSEN